LIYNQDIGNIGSDNSDIINAIHECITEDTKVKSDFIEVTEGIARDIGKKLLLHT